MATKLVLTSQKNPPALTVTDYSLDKSREVKIQRFVQSQKHEGEKQLGKIWEHPIPLYL